MLTVFIFRTIFAHFSIGSCVYFLLFRFQNWQSWRAARRGIHTSHILKLDTALFCIFFSRSKNLILDTALFFIYLLYGYSFILHLIPVYYTVGKSVICKQRYTKEMHDIVTFRNTIIRCSSPKYKDSRAKWLVNSKQSMFKTICQYLVL
jgi:hypothetical protein